MRHCLRCKQPKPLEEFTWIPSKADYYSYCKPCQKEYRKERYWNNREDELKKNQEWQKSNKHQRKNTTLMHRFGITMDYYNKLLKDQDEKCAICGVDQSVLDRKFAVDHDHVTDEVRGLLCQRCNSGIGYLYDNFEVVQKAADYLKEFRDKPSQDKVKIQKK